MPRSVRLYLWEIKEAVEEIASFTQDKIIADYERDRLLRRGVERMFEILGEALNQLKIHYPEELSLLMNTSVFIGFRNVSIHRYSKVDDTLVWLAVRGDKLPLLLVQVCQRLEELKRV